MATPITLPSEIEASVRFVEDTPPERVVQATLARLRAGEAATELLAASAIAVSRSTELPADHHGGPVHPVSGLHAVHHTAGWLQGDWSLMPTVHSVALANRHVHSPDMGPALMVELPKPDTARPKAETAEAFRSAVSHFEPVLAERLLLELLDTHTSGEVLNLLLETALRRNGLDDHYFLYAVHATRGMACIGWQWAPVVLRPVVRYLSSNMRAVAAPDARANGRYIKGNVDAYYSFAQLEALMEEFELLDGTVIEVAKTGEDAAIAELGEKIGECTRFAEIPRSLAEALAGGLSLPATGEALSYGAGLLHLRTDYGNPFDVHLHTGVNTRRFVLGLPEVTLRNKLLGLLNWALGPEIRLCEQRIAWPSRFDTSCGADLDQDALLDAITNSITSRPPPDLGARVEEMDCGIEVKTTLALAEAYTKNGYDAGAYFQRMGELVCRDDFSEMHAFKHLQAAVEEYGSTREQLRWVHLVSVAKMAWCTYGFAQDVYEQARPHLTF